MHNLERSQKHMRQTKDTRLQAHFHIRWGSGRLDWEPFNSRDDAEFRAQELVRSRETYSIEQFDKSCQRCKEWRAKLLRAKSTSSN